MVASVGRSSYGELDGDEQFVASQEIADQVSSLCYEFDTQYPGALEQGDRLTVNEGIRSVDRQILLYDQYLHHGGALAAYATEGPPKRGTSTHDPSRGSALDFGITMRDSRNRALTQPEFDWVHAHGVARGIQWTGRGFSRVEQWHHNGGYAASVPPITGVNRPGAALFTNPEPPEKTPVGDIMSSRIVPIQGLKGKAPVDQFLINPDTMEAMHLQSDLQVNYWASVGVPRETKVQPRSIIGNFKRVGKS